jgi:hypothetical protein
MFRKLQVVAALFSMLPYATAGTVSIGTASARGDMSVDNYAVKGNATLFDGSVVETGQASADLRLDKGTEITMSTSSKGTLYRDRLVLQQGKSELTASGPFLVEANGLRVTSNEPNSHGVVSMSAGNTVQVAALNGSFGVTNDHGVLLASVHPGRVVSFSIQAGAPPMSFEGVGMVSNENGHYYLTLDTGEKYEITGKDFKKYEGEKVVVSGTVQIAATQPGGASSLVSVSSIGVNGASSAPPWLTIGGVTIGAGVAVGFIVDQAVNQSSTPASR